MITLSVRTPPSERVEVESLTADALALLSEREIGSLPVWLGARRASAGDFFDVRGERSSAVRIEGDLALVDGIGEGMTGGELIVEGSAGGRVAAGMSGGRVEVRGSVGDDAGVAMSGGTLRVMGDAGARLGAAPAGASKGMRGGEIVVSGSAGADAAALLRRGLVVVGGDAGTDAARSMIAGTLVVLGRTAQRAGRGSRRGSIVAIGGIDVPPTYRYACTYRPGYLRVMLTYLRRRHGVVFDDRVVDAAYQRYCGDAGDPGKGEILRLVSNS